MNENYIGCILDGEMLHQFFLIHRIYPADDQVLEMVRNLFKFEKDELTLFQPTCMENDSHDSVFLLGFQFFQLYK